MRRVLASLLSFLLVLLPLMALALGGVMGGTGSGGGRPERGASAWNLQTCAISMSVIYTRSIAYTSRQPRRRLSGVEVIPGSVRRARLDAGLSLAQVGGDELTRQAIHLIETGKTRPSMRSLRVIAKRLGVPVSTFLLSSDPERAVMHGEHANELDRLCHLFQRRHMPVVTNHPFEDLVLDVFRKSGLVR